MNQSKFQLVQSQPDHKLYDIYRQLGSIVKVLTHFGFKNNDPRARKYISQAITRVTGNTYHTEKHGSPFDENLFFDVAPTCSSIPEILQKMGLQPVGGNFTQIRTRLLENNISLKPLNKKLWADNEVYCIGSQFNRRSLQNRVKRDGWLPYRCGVCSNPGEWLGTTLTLHLDHINGNNADHRKENLRWLCPNCHTQTPTFAGRNRK